MEMDVYENNNVNYKISHILIEMPANAGRWELSVKLLLAAYNNDSSRCEKRF